MASSPFFRLINTLPVAIEESLYGQPDKDGWIVGPPSGGFGTDGMKFVYDSPVRPPGILTAKFTGGIASFLVDRKTKNIFDHFRWGHTFQYSAYLRWQGKILEDYTLFECYNFVWEKDIDFQRTQFFAVNSDTQRAVHPALKFQQSEDLHQWHAAAEQQYGVDKPLPVELRIDRLSLAPRFVRQNDAFLIGLGYVPRYFRGNLYVNERLKAALAALPTGEIAFEATDYFEA